MSNNALFNDGEPVLVRATDGNYVGRVDPFKAQVAADQPAQAAVSEMKLFQNVPRASSVEKQFSGVVGVVTSDGTVAVKPVDNGFLNKMARPAKADEAVEEEPAEIVEEASVAEPAPEHDMSDLMSRMVRPSRQTVEALAEEVVEEAPTIEEAPVMESVIEEIPAEEIVAEAPAEEPVKEHEEFFIDTEEVPVEIVEEAEAEDTGAIETDDYSWVEFNEGEPAEAAVAEPSIEAAPAEVAVEEVVEAPIVETVETVVAEPATGFVEAPAEEVVEAPVVETVEEVVEEAPVEAPSTGFVEAPAEEIPADVTPSLPGLVVVPEGLHVEGNEPSNAATSSLDAVTTVPEQTTATSAVALEQNSKRATLPRDGEALPPMSDPVIKRPNSMRFRFDNGVLMNVSSKSKGSEEGARSPLE